MTERSKIIPAKWNFVDCDQHQNAKTRLKSTFQTGRWRSGWDSNPRTVARHLISSQGRYDHFDTAPRKYSL